MKHQEINIKYSCDKCGKDIGFEHRKGVNTLILSECKAIDSVREKFIEKNLIPTQYRTQYEIDLCDECCIKALGL